MNKLKLSELPFLVALISIFFPLLGGWLHVQTIHAPAILMLFAVACLIQKQKWATIYKSWVTYLSLFVVILLVVKIISREGVVILAMGGYVVIFAFLFGLFFRSSKNIPLCVVVNRVNIIFKVLIVSMLVELLLISLGFQPILKSIFRGYKDYNGADVLRSIGLFYHTGGLNSMLLGSQIAGMISLFSTIWFIVARACSAEKYLQKPSLIWVIISLALLVITINGTNAFLLVSTFLIWKFYEIQKYRLFKFSLLFSFILFIIYFAISSGYLLSRIFNERIVNLTKTQQEFFEKYGILSEVEHLTTIQFYIHNFVAPLQVWRSENLYYQLFGAGDRYAGGQVFVGGDFAFGSAILFAGIVFPILFLITVCSTLYQNSNIHQYNSVEQRSWAIVGFACALISTLFLLSTIHYGQAFGNPSVLVLFALLLALANYAKFRFNSLSGINNHS